MRKLTLEQAGVAFAQALPNIQRYYDEQRRETMKLTYWCYECQRKHQWKSPIGAAHAKLVTRINGGFTLRGYGDAKGQKRI